MKVLLTSYWSVTVADGLYTYVKLLMRGLEQHGIEVDVLTRDPEFTHYYLLKDGRSFPIQQVKDTIQSKVQTYYHYRFPGIDPWIINGELERYSFEAAATLFDLPSYDLIHAQEVISARALSRVKSEQIPLVSTLHGCWPLEAIEHGYVSGKETTTWDYSVFQDRLGVQACDQTIVPSNWLKNTMSHEIGIPMDRMTVIPFGLDVQSLQMEMNLPAPHPILEKGQKVILCAARLSKEKGHHTLLEALVKLKATREDWVCWLVGDGELQGELEKLCGQLNLQQHVRFLGHRDDVPAILRQADFCVYPSLRDTHPYAVMEAQTAGKAIIASDVGGIPEMVKHEKTGLLFPGGDADALHRAMLRLLDHQERRHKIERKAKQWAAKEWALDRMMQRTLETYEAAQVRHRRK